MATAKRDLNPFGGDDDTDKKIEAPNPQDPNEPEISLAAPEEAAADDDDDGPAADDEPGLTRKEKKRNRYQENKEARERAEKDAAAAREELARERAAAASQVQQALEQARQAIELARGQQTAGPKQPDPLDEQEAQINQERSNLYREFQLRQQDTKNPVGREEYEKFEKRLQDIEDKKIDIRAERKAAARMPQQQGQQQDPQLTAIQAHLAMEHPEIANSQQAQLWADGERRKLIAAGKPNTLETVKLALDITERELKIGKYKEQRRPDPTLKDKMTGPAKGAGAGGGEMPKSIKMTRGLQKLADHAFPQEKDPAKRYEKWAKTVGARLVAQGVDLSEYR